MAAALPQLMGPLMALLASIDADRLKREKAGELEAGLWRSAGTVGG